MNKKVPLWIIISFVLAFFGFCLWYQTNTNNALKNSTIVKADITGKGASRGSSIIFVKYIFDGRHFENSFDAIIDTFKVGQTILMKVSNDPPGAYAEPLKPIRHKLSNE
jgi:hypothetical protein